MGINIVLVKLVGIKNTVNYEYSVFITKEIEWFDSFRHFGDKDFHKVFSSFGLCKSEDDNAAYPDFGATRLWRVSRYDECRQWIKDNIVQVNQKRLLDAIDYMEQHKDIYFDFR